MCNYSLRELRRRGAVNVPSVRRHVDHCISRAPYTAAATAAAAAAAANKDKTPITTADYSNARLKPFRTVAITVSAL